MNRKDGGPAFPQMDAFVNAAGEKPVYVAAGGMTLRDYFAAKAMTAVSLKWDAAYSQEDRRRGRPETEARSAAIAAYRYADAMLKAREE